MWYEEACGAFCELRGAHCERLPAFSIVAGFIRTTTRAPPEKSRSAGTPFSPKRLRSSNLTTTYAAALLGSIAIFAVRAHIVVSDVEPTRLRPHWVW